MKYLIVILAFFTSIDAFAGGRVNPFTGQPITYSLSEMHARETMGAGAYDLMRRQTWAYRQTLDSALGRGPGHGHRNINQTSYTAHDFGQSAGNDYNLYAEDQGKIRPYSDPVGWANKKLFKHAFKIEL